MGQHSDAPYPRKPGPSASQIRLVPTPTQKSTLCGQHRGRHSPPVCGSHLGLTTWHRNSHAHPPSSSQHPPRAPSELPPISPAIPPTPHSPIQPNQSTYTCQISAYYGEHNYVPTMDFLSSGRTWHAQALPFPAPKCERYPMILQK